MGEALERREMLLAAPNRRAYVDELNASAPVRLVDYDAVFAPRRRRPLAGLRQRQRQTRWHGAVPRLLRRTNRPSRAQDEPTPGQRSLSTLAGLDRSLEANGAAVRVMMREERPASGSSAPAASTWRCGPVA